MDSSRMNLFCVLFLTVIVTINCENANSCEDILGNQLIEEIKSYENVRDKILEYVIEGDFKGKTYDQWVI